MVIFEDASCSIFSNNREKIFPDVEVGGGAGGINVIFSRLQVVDDVISGCNEETLRSYHAGNL